MATTVSAVTAAPEGATPAHKPWRTGLGRERILQVSFLVPAVILLAVAQKYVAAGVTGGSVK